MVVILLKILVFDSLSHELMNIYKMLYKNDSAIKSLTRVIYMLNSLFPIINKPITVTVVQQNAHHPTTRNTFNERINRDGWNEMIQFATDHYTRRIVYYR